MMLYKLNNNRVNDYDPAVIPATPEEIKEAHGKCGTCKYYEPDEQYCTCPYNYVVAPQPEDYCNHHEPKET